MIIAIVQVFDNFWELAATRPICAEAMPIQRSKFGMGASRMLGRRHLTAKFCMFCLSQTRHRHRMQKDGKSDVLIWILKAFEGTHIIIYHMQKLLLDFQPRHTVAALFVIA